MNQTIKAFATKASPVFDALEQAGHNAWLVGGCVRDLLLGEQPKDIDLATDATPEVAQAAYEATGLKVFATGLQHGTLTVVANGEVFEVTTLRTETDHDGRHANVAWTTSLEEDLQRRDLTINAMAATRTGKIIDPFNGAEDLANGVVRFVGDAETRIVEDYLRILRFFRFHTRFAGEAEPNAEALEAIQKQCEGLKTISVERIWSEMQKIIIHPAGAHIGVDMTFCGLMENMPFGLFYHNRHHYAIEQGVTNPAIMLAYIMKQDDAPKLNWSREEEKAFAFAKARHFYSMEKAKRDLADGFPRPWVEDAARFSNVSLGDWEAPAFPVEGKDLVKAGMPPGPAIGDALRKMRDAWAASDYTLTKGDLLKAVAPR